MVALKYNVRKVFLFLSVTSCISLFGITYVRDPNLYKYLLRFSTSRNQLDVELCEHDRQSSVGAFMDMPPQIESIVWVRGSGAYINRLSAYNDALAQLRIRVLEEMKNVTWKNISKQIKSTWSIETYSYLNITSRLPTVTTLALAFDQTSIEGKTWLSEHDKANLLIQSYYHWTATDKLCSWLTSKTSNIPYYAWGAVFMKKCESDLKKALCRTRLEPLFLNAKRPSGSPAQNVLWPQVKGGLFPDSYYFTLANHVHYIQVVKYGLVDKIGDVYTDAAKLVQFSCSCANPAVLVNKFTMDQHKLPLYEEVFVVSQLYNHVLYHSSIEDLPRAVPYLQFLKTHARIKIHTGPLNKVWVTMFEMLGIIKDRFVTGVVRAKVVYLPQLTPCGLNQVQALQLTSHLLRQHLALKYPDDKRDLILLIKRSRRALKHHDAINNGLSAAASEYNLALHVFDDKKMPTVKEIFRLFRRAVVVVGPHGAGLLNLVFTEPGVYVVEGVCQGGAMVLYYLWEAHTLGHRWHGVPGQSPSCGPIDASPNEIVNAVKHFLKFRRTGA